MNDLSSKIKSIHMRLDHLPGWCFPYKVLPIVGITCFFSCFDIIILGLALPTIVKQLHTSLLIASWSITTGILGYIFGAYIIGRVSDLFGRRLSLCLSVSIYSTGALLAATSTNIYWLIGWRFLIGIGLGAELASVMTYISELSPAKVRGKCIAIAGSFGFLGIAITPFIGLAIIPFISFGWRLLYIIGGALGFLFFVFRLYLPHSPRWLVSKGKVQEAEEIVKQAEDLASKRFGTLPSAIDDSSLENKTLIENRSFTDLFKTGYFKRLILLACIWISLYISTLSWISMSNVLLQKKGYSQFHSLLYISIFSLGYIVGGLLAIKLSDKMERKWLCSIFCFIMSISFLCIAWITSAATIIIAGFFISMTMTLTLLLISSFTTENFPTSYRATAYAITNGFGHIGGAFSGQLVLGIFAVFSKFGFGFQAAYTNMALFVLITAILLAFGTKMTKKSLMHTALNSEELEL